MDKFKLDLANALKAIVWDSEEEYFLGTEELKCDFDQFIFSDPRLKYKYEYCTTAISAVVMNIRILEEDSIPAELLINEESYYDAHGPPIIFPLDIRALKAFMLKLERAYSAIIEFLINSNDEELLGKCDTYLWPFCCQLEGGIKEQSYYKELFETALNTENETVKSTLMTQISLNLDKWNGWEKYVFGQPLDVVEYFQKAIMNFKGGAETNKVIIEYMLEHFMECTFASSILEQQLNSSPNTEIYTKRLLEIYKSGYDVLKILENAFKPKLTPNWIEVINYVFDRSPLSAVKILTKIGYVPDEFIVEMLERVTHKVTSENARNVLLVLYELHTYKQTEAYLFKTIDKIAQINTEILDPTVLYLSWSEGLLSYMLLNHSKLHNALLLIISREHEIRLKPLLPELVPYVVANIDSEVGVKAWCALCRADNDLCSKYRDLIPVCCKYDSFCVRPLIQNLSRDELIQYKSHLIPLCCRTDFEGLLNLISKVGMENLREFEPTFREMVEKRKGKHGWYTLTFYLTMLDEDKSKFTEKFPEWQKQVGNYCSCGIKAAVVAFGPEFLKGLVPILASREWDFYYFKKFEPIDYLHLEPCKNELMEYFSNLVSKGEIEAFYNIWRFVSVLSPDRQMVDTALQASAKFMLKLNYAIYADICPSLGQTFKTIIKFLYTTNLEANTAKDFIEALLRVIRERNITCQEIFDALIVMVKLGFHLPAEKLFATLLPTLDNNYNHLKGLKLLLAVVQHDESAIEPFGDKYAPMLAIFCFYSSKEVRKIAHQTLQSFSGFKPFGEVLNGMKSLYIG